MRRFVRLSIGVTLVVLALAGAFAVALRQGFVPPRYNPLAPVDLADATGWFLDWRIQNLGSDPDLCLRTLRGPLVAAASIKDKGLVNGCGWVNSVTLTAAGGASLNAFVVSCPVAAALSMWMAHQIQPLAERFFGSRVARLEHAGGFACRNIVSQKSFGGPYRSQHATANAVDILAFVLTDGRRIPVKGAWQGSDTTAAFLRAAHTAACGYFRVVLGPDYNPAHHDHFHFDRGVFYRCR